MHMESPWNKPKHLMKLCVARITKHPKTLGVSFCGCMDRASWRWDSRHGKLASIVGVC